MKTFYICVLVLLVCEPALCKKDKAEGGTGGSGGRKNELKRIDSPLGGRSAGTDENGGIGVQGAKRKCSIRIMGLVELNSAGQEISGTKNEERANITNKEMTKEDLPFSELSTGSGAVQAKCLSVSQSVGQTEVDLKCCVAKEDGIIKLGSNPSLEEFNVTKGYMKCSVTLKAHNFDAQAEKVCILTDVTPPGKGRSQACAAQPGNSNGNSNRKLPKKCNLGDGATMDLSTMAAEIPAGGDLSSAVWVQLDEADVGLTQVGAKMVGKFCIPKGNEGTTKWYDPTIGLEDEDYTGSAARIFLSLATTLASLLVALLL